MGQRRHRHGSPTGAGVTSLKGMIAAAREGKHLVVTGPHYDWLEMLEVDQMPSPAAVLHAVKVYLRLYKHPRAGRFSASSMGGCQRATVFGYAGAPQVAPEMSGQEIMDHGSTDHLKWQMEGLTMGYMTAAEVWVENKDLMVGGSIDAVLHDDSNFELKSCAPQVFYRMTRDEGPKVQNIWQDATYKLLRDVRWSSLVYVDRSYGKFHEYREERSAEIERRILSSLHNMKAYVEEDDLPPMLADCEIKWGPEYKQCFFREICPKVHTVSEAQAAGNPETDDGLMVAAGAQLPDWVAKLIPILEAASDVA